MVSNYLIDFLLSENICDGKITNFFGDLINILAVNIINGLVISIQFTDACTLTVIAIQKYIWVPCLIALTFISKFHV